MKMSAGGFTNYLDFEFAANPPCPRCPFRRSVGYVSRPYADDLPAPESPWEFYSEPQALGHSWVLVVPPLPLRLRCIARDRQQIFLTAFASYLSDTVQV
ncbi:hypothetical protein ACN9MI_07750 [Rhodococcoides fascians]|uniref:hypothetical protein n=1 Tax=Rhodococcoides fascians TaxID=1828 RepID=UPI00050BE982|nr:hypothetical protein [Rhodococcus fascians]